MTEDKCYCSRCGKPLNIWDVQEQFNLRRHLGYGTKYDGETLDMKWCCDCMESLIDECKISPIINT